MTKEFVEQRLRSGNVAHANGAQKALLNGDWVGWGLRLLARLQPMALQFLRELVNA